MHLFTESHCSQIKAPSPKSGHSKQEKLPWSGQEMSDSIVATSPATCPTPKLPSAQKI